MNIPKLSLLPQISAAHLVSHLHMMTLPALLPLMVLQGNLSYTQIGFALSMFNIISALTQAPVGFFVDKVGAMRILKLGLFIGSLSFLSLAFIDHYIWLVIAMSCAGIANAVYHPADYALLSNGIDNRRMGRAFSIHTFSGFLGTAITPGLLITVASFCGINSAFAVAGIIGLVVYLLLIPKAALFIAPGHAEFTSTKQSNKTKRKLSLITPAIISLLLLFLLLSLGAGSLQNFSVSAFTTGYSIPLTEANIALSCFLFASAFGVLAGGHLADMTKRHGLIAAGALAITAILMVVVATTNFSTLPMTLVMTIVGFLSGIITPSRDMMVREASPKGSEGLVFGIVSTGFNIGGAVGPILFGWLLDNGYPRMIFWLAASFMLLTVIISLSQERRNHNIHK